jgi:hypothetical protein
MGELDREDQASDSLWLRGAGPSYTVLLRIGAVLAILGVVVFLASGMFHPSQADPGDSAAAFAEYAAHDDWIAVHLGQFVGSLLMLGALVALNQHFSLAGQPGGAAALARLGLVAAVASIAAVALLQAVDGVALKKMVDLWAAAPHEEKAAAFRVAEGVRWIEVGINSYMRMLFGLTVALYGLAVGVGRGFPRWLGWVGLVMGLGWMAAGLMVGYNGFSVPTSMAGLPPALVMPALMGMALLTGYGFLVWVVVMGVLMWRRAGQAAAAS